MSKGSGMGSKRDNSRFNKGLGRCTGKHSEQCGLDFEPSDKHSHDKKHKHSFLDFGISQKQEKHKYKKVYKGWDEDIL